MKISEYPPPRVVGGVGRNGVGESGEYLVGILVIVPVVAQFFSIVFLSV